jgi:hypothetical protein
MIVSVDDAALSEPSGLSPEMMVLIAGGVFFAAYAFRRVAEETGKKHAEQTIKDTAEGIKDEAKELYEEYMP